MFDLYELSLADRQQIKDMCRIGLDFFYKQNKSSAVDPVLIPENRYGTLKTLKTNSNVSIENYLETFLRYWNADLEPDGELIWQIIPGPSDTGVLALLFATVEKQKYGTLEKPLSQVDDWNSILKQLKKKSLLPQDRFGVIYTDTFVRAVSDYEILIIKRNEQRFWTQSMALEDADATLAQAMNLAAVKNSV